MDPEVCQEHEISATLYYGWRDILLAGGKAAPAGKEERTGEKGLRRKIQEPARPPGRKTYEVEIAGRRHCEAGSERARRQVSRASRQGPRPGGRGAHPAESAGRRSTAFGGHASRRTPPGATPVDDVGSAIVKVVEANSTNGYRIVTAWACRPARRGREPQRVMRVMCERKLIERRSRDPRRRRPGVVQGGAPRPDWQLDMSSIWVAEHGWVYLKATIHCCTREIVAWGSSLRCRAVEANRRQRDPVPAPECRSAPRNRSRHA